MFSTSLKMTKLNYNAHCITKLIIVRTAMNAIKHKFLEIYILKFIRLRQLTGKCLVQCQLLCCILEQKIW